MTPGVRPSRRLLLDDGERDPVRGLAVDEALVRCARPQTTLRLWRLDRCVVIGRSQLAAAEVDANVCRTFGVPVLRRFTGGGAVYHDPGNLDMTLVVRRDDPALAARPDLGSIPGMFRLITEPLAEAIRALGLPARPAERAVLVGGSKVSGVAGWVGRDSILVHGTLLVDADLAMLDLVLAGPGATGDPRWERTRSNRVPVRSLAVALGEEALPGPSEIDAAIVAAFADGPGSWESGTLDPDETVMTRRLIAERYGRSEWHRTGDMAIREEVVATTRNRDVSAVAHG